MNYKKLDINLKEEDSEVDLLRYLQSKQLRTRRLSQAVWNQPIRESPDVHEAAKARRRSVAPVVVNNYRRRLSLAVPDENTRRRLASSGNVLKGLDSPARRRLRFKRGPHSITSDISDSQNLFPLSENIPEGDESETDEVRQTQTDAKMETNENKENAQEHLNKGALRNVLDGRTQHGSLKRTQTVDVPSPPAEYEGRKGGSFKGQASRQGVMRACRSPTQGVRLSDKGVKFVSPKHSPSQRKKPILKAQKEVQDGKNERHGRTSPIMRKNLSYSRALSSDILEPKGSTK